MFYSNVSQQQHNMRVMTMMRMMTKFMIIMVMNYGVDGDNDDDNCHCVSNLDCVVKNLKCNCYIYIQS